MNVQSVLSEAAPETNVLSEAECHDIAKRVIGQAKGGGTTWVFIHSLSHGTTRWGRNEIHTAESLRNDRVGIGRSIRGARVGHVAAIGNDTSERGLIDALRRVERISTLRPEQPYRDLGDFFIEPPAKPDLFSATTATLSTEARADVALNITQQAATAGMLSAGYINVSAHSIAAIDSNGRALYFPYTQARYTVTVRDPEGSASGWAGDVAHDWARIDATHLSALALEKCLKSRPPSRVEPGRYTTILEPQAVCDFVADTIVTGREGAELTSLHYYNKTYTRSRIGEKLFDERITVTSDPMDPLGGFPPFAIDNVGDLDSFATNTFHPTTWIERGVLTNLGYERSYAMRRLNKKEGMPFSGAFRMSGGTTTIEEMIATTQRGLLVIRLSDKVLIYGGNATYRGYTRDGLWLIENGKITKPAKNLAFTESVLFALNNVEQIGVPQRVVHVLDAEDTPLSWMAQPQPVIVPPLKIRDFSFTSLTDAV